MKGEQISDALQLLRNDTIEETERVRSGKRKTVYWRKWAAVAAAACLCVVAGVTALYPVQIAEDTRITAEKITEKRAEYSRGGVGGILLGGGTKAYVSKNGADLQELMWSPVRDNTQTTALPVFQPRIIKNRNLNRYADECTEFFAQGLRDVLGVSGEITEDVSGSWRTDLINCGEWSAAVRIQNDQGALQAQYILDAPDGTPLFGTVVPVEAGDEEILAAVTPVLDVFNAVFGKRYEAQVVHRSTDTNQEWVYVYAWENSDDPAQQLYSTYLDFVYIILTNSRTSDKSKLHLSKAWHTVNELEPISEEDVPLLSLAEAEEELEKGYIFLGHVCPICMSANAEVDFSDYDGVEIVYRGSTFYTYNIPYYAFYKQTGEETFAVTYVPAVKVEGMEEYFQAQEVWHR